MRIVGFIFLIAALANSAFPAEPGTGSVCIAPADERPIQASAPGLFCDSEKLSLRIDNQQAVPWPLKGSVKVATLDPTIRHRVRILRWQSSAVFHISFLRVQDGRAMPVPQWLVQDRSIMGGERVPVVQVQVKRAVATDPARSSAFRAAGLRSYTSGISCLALETSGGRRHPRAGSPTA